MNKMNSLDQLGLITDEMLAGLHADQQMKMRIRAAAAGPARPRRSQVQRFAPALCCAALAIACVGAVNLRGVAPEPQAARIATIAAGDPAEGGEQAQDPAMARMRSVEVADLGDHARVGASSASGESLYARGDGDIPLVTVNGAVYRMLAKPQTLSSALCGGEVGKIALVTDEPSLASGEEMKAGLTNVADEGCAVYSVSGLSSRTAVAAEVGGQMRLFQRVSYAGKGPGKQTLEDTLDVRGKVKSLSLSGVGEITGDTANAVIAVLLDSASLKAADASAARQTLTVTLQNGLRLQLGVSGDTVTGCGGWSCPEFFEAFHAAL